MLPKLRRRRAKTRLGPTTSRSTTSVVRDTVQELSEATLLVRYPLMCVYLLLAIYSDHLPTTSLWCMHVPVPSLPTFFRYQIVAAHGPESDHLMAPFVWYMSNWQWSGLTCCMITELVIHLWRCIWLNTVSSCVLYDRVLAPSPLWVQRETHEDSRRNTQIAFFSIVCAQRKTKDRSIHEPFAYHRAPPPRFAIAQFL